MAEDTSTGSLYLIADPSVNICCDLQQFKRNNAVSDAFDGPNEGQKDAKRAGFHVVIFSNLSQWAETSTKASKEQICRYA